MKIYLIAGEQSGDQLGGALMRALKEQSPDIEFCGIGGAAMQAEGLESLFPMSDLSLMGIAEIVPKVPHILRRIGQTADDIVRTAPDILITIDAPDFCFRVARKVRERLGRRIRLVHYVAPTVWAWRPERAKKLAEIYDLVLCLFPFEPPYFEREGMRAVFAGHPAALDHNPSPRPSPSGRGGFMCGVFFGSRPSELQKTGEIFKETMIRLQAQNPGIAFLLPTTADMRERLSAFMDDFPGSCRIETVMAENKAALFSACDIALAVSGTVGLELALLGVPHVIGYRMNRLTWEIVRRKVRTDYAHLANIILDQRDRGTALPLVPEFIQDACTAENLAAAMQTLIDDPEARQRQREAAPVLRQLLTGGADTAQAVLNLISRDLPD